MTLDDDGSVTARTALRRVAGNADPHGAVLEPLAGGTHRRSWRVTFADGTCAVLRMPVLASNALLDIETEVRAMDAAAGAGIAPSVIAADAESGVLLTDYRPGTPWTPADVRRTSGIDRLTAVLRTLHALPTELPAFCPARIAHRYLAALPRDVRDPRVAAWSEEFMSLARRYEASYAPTAFCHNDLVAANVLDAGELVLVDFEYAVRADPLLDLANVAGMNGFNGGERRALLAAYRRAEPTDGELAELAWLVRMVRLMAWFWALLGVARADESSLYAPYLLELGAELKQE
jgi:thiamine kinase-like enzyme